MVCAVRLNRGRTRPCGKSGTRRKGAGPDGMRRAPITRLGQRACTGAPLPCAAAGMCMCMRRRGARSREQATQPREGSGGMERDFFPLSTREGGLPGEHGEGGGRGRAGWREGHTNPHTQGGGGHSQEVQFPHAHTHTHTHPRQKTFVSANREKEEHGEHGEGGREGGTHTHTHTLSPHERGASRGSTGREGGREGVGREGRTHARARARARTRTHTQTHTKHRVRDPFPTYTHTPHTHIQAGTRTHIQAG